MFTRLSASTLDETETLRRNFHLPSIMSETPDQFDALLREVGGSLDPPPSLEADLMTAVCPEPSDLFWEEAGTTAARLLLPSLAGLIVASSLAVGALWLKDRPVTRMRAQFLQADEVERSRLLMLSIGGDPTSYLLPSPSRRKE